jgi:ELWxxDGT repeat protein
MKKIVVFLLFQIPLFILAQINEPVKVFSGLRYITDATHFNGKIYFKAVDSKNNTAWYVSEGDSLSTKKIYSLSYNLIVSSVSPQVLNNKLYFLSGRNSLISIDEQSIIDSIKITPKANFLTLYNNQLYFLGDTATSRNSFQLHNLYKIDLKRKTFSSIYYFKFFVSGFYTQKQLLIYQNKLVFEASDSVNTKGQLWISDGTEFGTKTITNIYYKYGTCNVFNFLFVNEFKRKLYFNSYDTINDCEPNYIDQKFDSVKVLKDIYKGNFCYNGYNIISASNFYNFKNEMYFLGVDSTNGSQLWKTDGTENGTRMIKKIINLKTDQNKYYTLTRQIFSNSDYLFVSPIRDDTIYGNELYIGKNDSFELFDFTPGPFGSDPQCFYLHNNHVYFVAHDWKYNYNLWISDGTKQGTYIVSKSNSKSSNPLFYPVSSGNIEFDNRFFSYNGSLYFEANYDGLGWGLYRLNDTTIIPDTKTYLTREELRCYPNPTKNEITIAFTTKAIEKFELKMVDILGTIFYTETFIAEAANNFKPINVAKFPSGNYLISLQSETLKLQSKIEIVH